MTEKELREIIENLIAEGKTWNCIGHNILHFCDIIKDKEYGVKVIDTIKNILNDYDNNDMSYLLLRKMLDNYK